MDPITSSFINIFNLLKRRQLNLLESNKELEMLNSVSNIFGANNPSVLTIHTANENSQTNKTFIKAVESLEKYHIEQHDIQIETQKIERLQKELNNNKLKLSARKAEQTKQAKLITQIFNTDTKENFILKPNMQISFK